MSKSKKKPDFRFFVPLEINKGKDKDGNEEMLIEGVASTNDEDSDGEFLDPNGYELDYFKKFGFFNWQHRAKQDPTSIVGEPVDAKIKDGNFWVKGRLFSDNPLAKGIYQLATNLKNSGSEKKIGFSIEGKALERDPFNPKIVKRAKITGVAITPTPKNANTFMDICKGEYSTEDYEYDDEVATDFAEANGGDTEYLVNITTPDGTQVKISKSFETTIIANKSLNTSNGAALMSESLEGGEPKNLVEDKKKKKYLSKSEVYDDIFCTFPESDLDIAKSIYNFTEQVQEKINPDMKNITPEAVNVAKELLKAATAENDLEKGQGDDKKDFPINSGGPAEQGTTNEANGASQSDFNKGYELMKACYKDGMEKAELFKAMKDKMEEGDDKMSEEDMEKAYEKMMSDDMKKGEGAEDDETANKNDNAMSDKKGEDLTKAEQLELKKAEAAKLNAEIEELEKAEEPEVQKGSDYSAIEDLIKGQTDNMNKKFEALGTLHAKQEENQELLKSQMDTLNKRIEELENEPVRRTVPASTPYMQKGEEMDLKKSENGKVTLSASQHKNEIVKALDGCIDLEKGDSQLVNEFMRYESSSYLTKGLINELNKAGFEIVK